MAGSWRKVATLEEVPPGALKAVRSGQLQYALANVGGTLYALVNDCPHRGGPLAGGRLLGDEIACGWHGFRFKVRSGEASMPADHDPAIAVPVRVVEGSIELQIDSDGGGSEDLSQSARRATDAASAG